MESEEELIAAIEAAAKAMDDAPVPQTDRYLRYFNERGVLIEAHIDKAGIVTTTEVAP